jgi:subtilase family serine protease
VNASGKYLFAVIDALNSVAETNETNNAPMYGPIP